MKNKNIGKDVWYQSIGVDRKYFVDNYITWKESGSHHRDHLLPRFHINNFGQSGYPLIVMTNDVNGTKTFLGTFDSSKHFGYLPNYNRYEISELTGEIKLYEYVDKTIINEVERETASIVSSSQRVLSRKSIECFLKMFAIQQSFRNFKLNADINDHIDVAYDLTFPKYFDLMLDQHLWNKTHNPYNIPIMTDDEFFRSADFSKKKNYLKVGFLKQGYDNLLKTLNQYKYGYTLTFDDVFLTSDTYGCVMGGALYIPISSNKLVIISKEPYKTHTFEYDWIPSINRVLWDQKGLFCVWGSHYKLPIVTATMSYMYPVEY